MKSNFTVTKSFGSSRGSKQKHRKQESEVDEYVKGEKNNFIENGIANYRIIVFVDKIQKKINSIPEIRKSISVVDYLDIIHDNFNEESEEKSYLND